MTGVSILYLSSQMLTLAYTVCTCRKQNRQHQHWLGWLIRTNRKEALHQEQMAKNEHISLTCKDLAQWMCSHFCCIVAYTGFGRKGIQYAVTLSWCRTQKRKTMDWRSWLWIYIHWANVILIFVPRAPEKFFLCLVFWSSPWLCGFSTVLWMWGCGTTIHLLMTIKQQ